MTRPVLKVEGLEEVRAMLKDIAPRHARNLMRATIFGVAQEIRDHAKRAAPKDTGTLRKAIKAVRRKSHPDAPVAEVRVTHGAQAKNDAFYWRFVEYGSAGDTPQPERPFIRPAAEKARTEFTDVVRRQFAKKLEAKLRSLARRQAKARG